MNFRTPDARKWQKVILALSDGTAVEYMGPAQIKEGETVSCDKVLATVPKELPPDTNFEPLLLWEEQP